MGKRQGVTKGTKARRARHRAARSIVARRIEEIRKARGWSCGRLGAEVGASRLRVWRLENGFAEVSATDAALYAEALGVSVASLYREGKS